MRLVGEGLHHADAAHILLDAGVEIAHPAEQSAEILRHPAAVMGTEPGHDRHDGPGDEGEMHVDHHHQRKRADEGHDGDEHILRPVMGHLAHLFQILGDAGDEMAGLLIVEKWNESFWRWSNARRRMSVSMLIPSMCPQ